METKYLSADGGGAGGSFGDAFPGEEPQAIEDRNQRLDTDAREAWDPGESYNFVYANGQFHISDAHDHTQLADHSGITPDHTGPMAMGHVNVEMGKATFEIQSNVSAQGLARVLKDYCKDVGWRWGGMVDLQGEPVGTGSEFAPVKSRYLTWAEGENELQISILAPKTGKCAVIHADSARRAFLHGRLPAEAWDALQEYANDFGLTLYGGNDNVLKRHEDLEIDNNYTPEWNDEKDHHLYQDPPDERKPGGVYNCPECGRIFHSWGTYLLHRRKEEPDGDDQTEQSTFPTLDPDATFPPNTSEPLKFYEGAMTLPQEQRAWQNLYPSRNHEVVHQFADGSTVRRSTSPEAASKVGEMMRNCWQGLENDPEAWEMGPRVNEDWKGRFSWNSLHDEHGIPRVAFYTKGGVIHEPLGMRNYTPHPKYAEQLVEYAKANNLMFNEPGFMGRPSWAKHPDDWLDGTKDFYDDQYNEQHANPELRGASRLMGQARVAAPSMPDPKDILPAPVPFMYDIQEDAIFVGQAGQKHSDIPGHFTPGGIVEGSYEPGGSVLIRSMTNMPYSVRHMLELWTYQHPEMEIRNVHLLDDEGKKTKLAAQQDIGSYIKVLASSDPAVWRAYKALLGQGGQVFVVGGAVRDALMGKEPNDIDLMVTGLPAEDVRNILAHLPGRVDLTGKDFGVFRYKDGSHEVEIALPRRERSTGNTDDRNTGLDVQADHTMTPEEDLFRRDFTANAMAVDLSTGQLIDPFDGSTDVRKRQLRTLNTKSLADDPLRIARALTAFSKHGLYPTAETKEQMTAHADELKRLPQERIQMDLDKLFKGDNPSEAIRLAQETGVLQHIFPEVAATYGWSQNNPHHELELFDHLLNVAERAKERKPDDPDFVLAALLHDIGKKDSHWTECRSCGAQLSGHVKPCSNCGSDDTSGHFYKLHKEDGTSVGANHEDVGATLARQRLNELKYPKERINRITDLVQHHMFPAFNTEKGARRFMNQVGDHADDLLHLRWADQGGKSEYPTDPSLSVDGQQALVNKAREEKAPTQRSQLAVNGGDLMAAGIPQGPQIGQILNYLVEATIENPELNTKEALLGLAHAWRPSQATS